MICVRGGPDRGFDAVSARCPPGQPVRNPFTKAPPAGMASMKKVTTHSLADQAREMIRTAIFEGTIKPEEKLTIERLAADLGISRTPVREALKSLEADGIVKLLPHRGAVVQRFDEHEIHDRYSVRANLEGYATEQACHLHRAALVAELEANCAAMQALIDAGADDLDSIAELVTLNARFHQSILTASDSPVTQRMHATLHMPTNYRVVRWRDGALQRTSLKWHTDIVDALRENKPKKARKLMEDHILEARDFILKQG